MVQALRRISPVQRMMLAGMLVLGVTVLWFGQDAMARSAAAGRKISGTVLDSTGRPAVNIPVKLVKAGSKTGGPVRRGPNDSPTGDAVIGAPDASHLQKAPGDLRPGEKLDKPEIKTDASGKFAFTDVANGKYQIIAGAGMSAVREPVFVSGDTDPPPLVLKLPPAK